MKNNFKNLPQASFVTKLKPLSPKEKRLRLKRCRADEKAVQKFLDVKRRNEEYAKKHPSKITFAAPA